MDTSILAKSSLFLLLMTPAQANGTERKYDALKSKTASAYIGRSLVHLYIGAPAQAAAEATKALEQGAQAPAYNVRSAAYAQLGRFQEAKQDAEEALRLDPLSARACYNRAVAREFLEEGKNSALADYKRAADLNLNYRTYYDQALARFQARGPRLRKSPWTLALLAVLVCAALLADGFLR